MKKILYFKINLLLIIFLLSLFPSYGLPKVFQCEKTDKSVPSLAPMLTRVLPAVVSMYIKGSHPIRHPVLPKEFKYFFGPDFPGSNDGMRSFEGLGSGVIINAAKGYVITNHHVIHGAEKIKVQLNDGREFEAKLIGKDEKTDLALLQLPCAKNLSELVIADSDNLKVGDFAVAIGNPFGIGQTATSGIISALGRSGINLDSLENFIQTDASINRGNSGGALVNLNGELIGINTAILTPGGGNIGIGFAIPSNIVKRLSQQLIEYGEVKHGQLGIKGTELTIDIAKALNIEAHRGAFISEVLPNSAAEKSGIKPGDVIVSLENKQIQSFAELRANIGTTAPGKTIKLGILRNGKLKTILVTLDDDDSVFNEKIVIPALKGIYLKNYVSKDGTKGIRVNNVEKNSPAANVGLKKGDIIVGVNREKIDNLSQLRKFLESKPVMIVLNIIRGNANIFLLVR